MGIINYKGQKLTLANSNKIIIVKMWLTSKNEKKKKKAVALEHYGPALSVSRVQSPLERSSSSSDSLLSFPVVLDSLSLNSLCLFNTTVHY